LLTLRTLFVLLAVALLAPSALGKVWAHLYRYDGVTPLAPVDANDPAVYGDIMVGTHLVLAVSSDAVVNWSGALWLSWDDANELTLTGRGYDPKSWNYAGSCLAAAGKKAMVQSSEDTSGWGFWYNNDRKTAVPGDWFAFDYQATQVGSVAIEVRDLDPNSGTPVETLSFTHVPSRDFNGDHIVNFEDFASLAGLWRAPVIADAGRGAAAFDLDANGRIDAGDLARFTERWLERTGWGAPAADPNGVPAVP
jgi:hypothetical protein